ncbi:MAG: branched-chain amino acid transport system ATP-binding protein [Actinomycetota bacterium]
MTDQTTDVVDLGSVEDVETGTSLALRDYHEQLEHHDDDESTTFFKRIGESMRSYAELRHTPYGLTPIVVLGGAYLVQLVDSQAFTIAGPTLARDLQLNVFQIISIFVLIGFFTSVTSLVAAYWSDRTKRLPFVGIGSILGGVAGMFSGKANSFGSLATTRSFDDSASGFGFIPIYSLIADYYPVGDRGRVFALNGMMRGLAGVVGIVAVGLMVDNLGFRTTFMISGAAMIVMGVLVLVLLREPVRGYMERKQLGADDEVANFEGERQSFSETWRNTLAIRTVKRLMISDGISEMGSRAVELFTIFFFAEIYHLSAFDLSMAILPSNVTGIIGGWIGGGLVDRFMRTNPSRVLTVSAIYSCIAAVGVIGYALRPPIAVLIAAQATLTFGRSMIGPALKVVYANVLPPRTRTTSIQITELALIPALVLSITTGGVILERYGYNGVFYFGAFFLFLSGLVQLTVAPFYDLDMRSALAATMAEEEWRQAKKRGNTKLLVCRDIEVEYSGVKVLFGVDFDVDDGEIVALLGTNGAGKSTLLRAISGITQASSGAVVFDGRDVTAMPPHEVTARGVVFNPGGRGVFPAMTVRENLMLGNWLTNDVADADARLEEMFELFPALRERQATSAGSLSGGEQQQLSLAQAFLCKPRLLLIDELSLGLSPTVVASLLEIVRRIRDTGVTVVVVEQSVNVALELADRAVFMEKGEVKFSGPTAELLERPDILRAVYVKGSGALTEGAPAVARRREGENRLAQLNEARPILEVEGLEKRYGGIVAVDGATFDLREGGVLGLIGPNGAGKTTIFDMISGYQMPDNGRVRFDGVDITSMAPEERAKRKLIRRFQDARLFPSLTVFETLLVSLEQQVEVRSSLLAAIAAPQARASERRLRMRAERLIELLELGDYRDKFVKELSTGLRRIVDLACVLGAEPTLLLLDEPSSGIAQAEAESLGPLLKRVRFETGCSILIIEHDMPLISAVSDELVALERGRVIVRGLPTDVLNDERVIESYLGDKDVTVKRSGALT